jgi:protein-disulfide isomerase
MTFRLRVLATAAALLLVPGLALADEFTGKQKDEIGQIVRDYLMAHPEVLLDVSKELEKRQKEAEAGEHKTAIADNAKEIYHSTADFVAGNPKGDVTLVEFFDYNCPWCKKSVPELQKLIERDNNVRVVLKEFPIFGEESEYAARAALAAKAQGKYWQFHEALFAHEGKVNKAIVDEIAKEQGLDMAKLKAEMEKPETQAIVERNQKLAQALGIDGTPGFVVNDQILPGYLPYRGLAAAVEGVREAGGCSVC